MKKVIKQLYDQCRYTIPSKFQTQNFELQDLWSLLYAWGDRHYDPLEEVNGLRWEWLRLDKTVDGAYVELWDRSELKKQAKKEGLSKMEQDAFDAAYEAYYDKRREDISRLRMSIQNYTEIVQKWQNIVLQQRPNYIILSQDDAGCVDLIGKDELSESDLADMRREHEKYLKYKAAYDKYVHSRPDIVDDLWHGPESSEYESDWQEFLDEPLD